MKKNYLINSKIFFFILLFSFQPKIFSKDLKAEYIDNFVSYGKLKKLPSSDLIKIYDKTKINDTKEKISQIISNRNIDKSELNIKISLTNRILITKYFNDYTLNQIKYLPYYFIPITYLDKKIFTENDSKYLFRLLQEAIKQKKEIVIQRVFTLNVNPLKFFNAIILMKTIPPENKIFFTSSLLNSDLKIKNKKKFNINCLKKLYKQNNKTLLNNILYLLPKFFNFKENDLIVIYKTVKNKNIFLNSLLSNDIKLPQKLINLIDLNNDNLFYTLLLYSDKNNVFIKKINKALPNKIKKNKNYLLYATPYLNKKYIRILIKDENLTIQLIEKLNRNNISNKHITEYALKNFNNLKISHYQRIVLTKYLIQNKKITHKKLFDFILSLFKNKKLEYKTDEEYIYSVLPLLAQNYNSKDFKYYLKLLNTLNKTTIETTLQSIVITKDKRFIKRLTELLKEKEINYQVKKAIFKLKDI